MDSLPWSKEYPILAINRLYLHHTLGFSQEQIATLSDEEMSRIAERVYEQVFASFTDDFDEAVRFIVACEIVKKNAPGGQDA